MKLLMENKRKQMIYIGVMAVCLGVTGWLWFGSGTSGSGAPSVELINAAMNVASNSGAEASPAGSAAGLLPYGTEFKMDILSVDAFKVLVAPKILEVKSEELGRKNPFGDPKRDPHALRGNSSALSDQPYRDEGNGYAIRFPSGWEVKPQPSGTRVVALDQQPDTEGTLAYRPNIGIDIGDSLTGGLSKEIARVRGSFSSFVEYKPVIDFPSFTRDGSDAYFFELTYITQTLPVHSEVFVTVANNKTITASCTALGKVWETHRDICEAALGSFEILSAKTSTTTVPINNASSTTP